MEESSSFVNRSPPMAMAYLAELRKESSASVVGFTDPCPCCGNKKRRCLYPSSDSRKKLLVFDFAPSSSNGDGGAPASDSSLKSPSGDRSVFSLSSGGPISSDSTAETSPAPKPVLADRGTFKLRCSDPKPPVTPPPPPAATATPVADQPPSSDSGAPLNPTFLERSNSSVSSPKPVGSSAEDDKRSDVSVSSPKPMGSAAKDDKGRGGEEVRVGVKCKCGIVREIILIR